MTIVLSRAFGAGQHRSTLVLLGYCDLVRMCSVPEDAVGAALAEPAKRPSACSRPEKSAI